MDSVADLERRLVYARKREADALARCLCCNGTGWIRDTSFDRVSEWEGCRRCRCSGLPAAQFEKVISDAMAGLCKPKPADSEGF
jgi:hypothetical protein